MHIKLFGDRFIQTYWNEANERWNTNRNRWQEHRDMRSSKLRLFLLMSLRRIMLAICDHQAAGQRWDQYCSVLLSKSLSDQDIEG